MSSHREINIRSWHYSGQSALDNLVLGIDERAVMDNTNVLSSDEFDACLAIISCHNGFNIYAHLAQVVGFYKGDVSKIWDNSPQPVQVIGQAYEIKPITHIHHIPVELSNAMNDTGFPEQHRVAIVHYLFDMG